MKMTEGANSKGKSIEIAQLPHPAPSDLGGGRSMVQNRRRIKRKRLHHRPSGKGKVLKMGSLGFADRSNLSLKKKYEGGRRLAPSPSIYKSHDPSGAGKRPGALRY